MSAWSDYRCGAIDKDEFDFAMCHECEDYDESLHEAYLESDEYFWDKEGDEEDDDTV